MNNKRTLTKKYKQNLDTRAPAYPTSNGFLGAPDGVTIAVPNRDHWVYVRMWNGDIVQAFNDKVPATYGLPVLVEWRTRQYFIKTAVNAYNEPIYTGLPDGVQSQLSWPGAQAVSIYGEQFVPGLVAPLGGLIVRVYGGSYYDNTAASWVNVPPVDVNMLGYTPGIFDPGAIWALIEMDATGGVTVTTGGAQPIGQLVWSEIPAPTRAPLAVIALYFAQTDIIVTPYYRDIYDLRFFTSGGGGGGGVTPVNPSVAHNLVGFSNTTGGQEDSGLSEANVSSAVSLKHTQGTDTALGALGTKNPPIDADLVIYRDSAAADALVTSTWTQVKAFLKTYFDGVYAAITHALLSATHSDTVAGAPVLGGIVAANVTPAWQQVAGNITTTQKFLAQTGTGAVSALPAWATLPLLTTITYYLQNTASAVATYKKLLVTTYTPKFTDSTASLGAGNTTLRNFITEAGAPGLVFLPQGIFEFHVHAAQTGGTKSTILFAEIWEANAAGADIAKIGTTESTPALTGVETEYDLTFATNAPYVFASTASRLVLRVIATVSGGGSAPTATFYYGDLADSHFTTPAQNIDMSQFVPYAGATQDINLGHKITNLTNGTAAADAAAFGQIPTALPPNGSASGDLAGSYPSPTVKKASADFSLSGAISPAQITGNQNDYNPAGLATATILQLTSDASRNITGIAVPAFTVVGRMLVIENVGSFPIVLINNSVSSTSGNRFQLPGASITINASCSITLFYTASFFWQMQGYIDPASYALLASPVFTGDPQAPTPAANDNDTSVPTTAWVNSQAGAGWIPASGTWSYSSADAPTFVISVNADMTGIITVGQKIKLTQTTVKYFIVTAVGAFAGGATLVTVYGGTDYTLANAAITLPFYSPIKNPFGFPVSPAKWTVSVTDSSDRTSATGTSAYKNLNAADTISMPIGLWWVNYSALVGGPKAAGGTIQPACTLSTANNSASDANTTMLGTAQTSTFFTVTFRLTNYLLAIAAKTTYYLNVASLSFAIDNINTYGATSTTQIWLVCAYL